MGKKKEAKEANALFKAQEKSEYEWAKKRGKEYPLCLADQQLYQQEKLIQQRFWEMKDILINGNMNNITSKAVSTVNNAPKPWPFWTYCDVISDEKLYHLMTKTEMDKAVSKIKGTVHCSISCYTPGYTELSLSYKSQCCEESGHEFYFDRASIMVSPSQNIAKHLYIGADDKVNATFYAGYDIDDEDEDPWSPPMIGFLVFTDKNNENHAIELEEFCALVEIQENKEYLFTFYNKTENTLVTANISGLEDIEFLVKDGKAEVITKGEESNDAKGGNSYIGQTFGKLTAIKPIERKIHGKKAWLFQCACGNMYEAVIAQVKYGSIKSCGCVLKEMLKKRIPDVRKQTILAEGTNVCRIATNKINANNTSGIRGVSRHKREHKWTAQIQFQRKQYWLGAFDNIEDATHARKMAEKRYFEPIIEKYIGTAREPNSDSDSGKRQNDIPEERKE